MENYDLILVDFQLDRGERGNDIIENIRHHRIYTEIIFYSQDLPGIRDVLNQHFIDGVYIASRNGEDFRDKFEKVFLSTVKKAQDISTIRGLVISEASELDEKVLSLILAFFAKYPQKDKATIRDYVFQDIVGDIEEKGRETLAHLTILEDDKLVVHGYFDAFKKMRILGRIIEVLNNKALVDKKTFTKKYKEEIIEVRNELAHCVEREDEGKKVLVTKDGKKVYDDDLCKTIRKNIIDNSAILDAIEEYIQKVTL